MKLVVLLVLFTTCLFATTIAQNLEPSCYFFSGTGSWVNTNITNGKLFYQNIGYYPSSGDCERAKSCFAFGGYAGGQIMLYSDDTIESVSLFGVGLRVSVLSMTPAFMPDRRQPFDKSRFSGLGVGASYYVNNTAVRISEDNERISSSDFFPEELGALNEELDKQLLELYNPKFQEGNNDDPLKIWCGTNYPLCMRKDKITYIKRGDVFDATNSAVGYADFDFDVFSMQAKYQCTINLSHGVTCGNSGVEKYQSGYIGSSLIKHYACEAVNDVNYACTKWVQIFY